MDQFIKSDLMVVALELRLAARDAGFTSRRLTEPRLLELADLVENAMVKMESASLDREVAALTALGRRSS